VVPGIHHRTHQEKNMPEAKWIRVLDQDTGHEISVTENQLRHGNYRVIKDAPATDAVGRPLPPTYGSAPATQAAQATASPGSADSAELPAPTVEEQHPAPAKAPAEEKPKSRRSTAHRGAGAKAPATTEATKATPAAGTPAATDAAPEAPEKKEN
jgi:hypothetical protein